MANGVEQEIRGLIQKQGRITFAQFQQACLYSPQGGFYASRENRISAHFRTSPTSHPVFGALIARQLEEMWRLLGRPSPFHVIEVGSGDGALARSIATAALQEAPGLAEALVYVAADYEPWWPASSAPSGGLEDGRMWGAGNSGQETPRGIQRVKAEGARPFRKVVGCILCNELLDNFPVHRFVIQGGRAREVYVTLGGDSLAEAVDEPSTPRIQERLDALGLSLPEGYRGEVDLALEDWAAQVGEALERGFMLTLDYGEPAQDLYSAANAQGTLVCFQEHDISDDPYQHPGQQDITSQVDFTSLMRLGEQAGLRTAGYTTQRQFLEGLGFWERLEGALEQEMSYAHRELMRMAMMSLVDPEGLGSLKALAQSKGLGPGVELLGFRTVSSTP